MKLADLPVRTVLGLNLVDAPRYRSYKKQAAYYRRNHAKVLAQKEARRRQQGVKPRG